MARRDPGPGRPDAQGSGSRGPGARDSDAREPDGQAVRLRAMVRADVVPVSELEQRLFPVDAWPLQMFYDELAHDTRHYLLAEAGGRIVGYAGLMCLGPIADVQTIAVLPEFEGRGIGSALLTALIAEAGRRQARDVLLEVRADNPRAQELYRRFGFEQIHIRPRYYRDGTDALIMRLQLPGPEGEVRQDSGEHAQSHQDQEGTR